MNYVCKSLLLSLLFGLFALHSVKAADVTLLNVSYDPTRELYKAYNEAFASYWKAKTGDRVSVKQSHGGGGKQTRAVIEGLEADVVTFALAADVDQLYLQRKLLPENWQTLLPSHSSPYTSTIVFMVRKGNPKGIKDWSDLVKPGISVITPNPKTSGGARWNYLAAWLYALKHNNQSEEAAKNFVAQLYKNTSVLDTGARGSTTTFAEREIGDVLITWENEAYLVLKEFGADKYELVTPTFSILAEPPVAVVEEIAKKHGTTQVANEYLQYLYSQEGQTIIAKNYYRPIDPEISAKYSKQFPNIELATIRDLGGWTQAQKKHFADNGIFDQIITENASAK
jgi:sulfate transport system substrate-binding protein